MLYHAITRHHRDAEAKGTYQFLVIFKPNKGIGGLVEVAEEKSPRRFICKAVTAYGAMATLKRASEGSLSRLESRMRPATNTS